MPPSCPPLNIFAKNDRFKTLAVRTLCRIHPSRSQTSCTALHSGSRATPGAKSLKNSGCNFSSGKTPGAKSSTPGAKKYNPGGKNAGTNRLLTLVVTALFMKLLECVLTLKNSFLDVYVTQNHTTQNLRASCMKCIESVHEKYSKLIYSTPDQ